MAFSKFFLLHILTIIMTQSPFAMASVGEITNALFDKGYVSMALTLGITFNTLIHDPNTMMITIFCAPDRAFLSSIYPQPPLRVLKYHIATQKLNKDALISSLGVGSKIDTLLDGHPLVLTTIQKNGLASIDNVSIKDWNIYEDDRVIVHGIEDFFDPEFQPSTVYPGKDIGVKSDTKVVGYGAYYWWMTTLLLIMILFVIIIDSMIYFTEKLINTKLDDTDVNFSYDALV